MSDFPRSLIEFQRRFPDEEACAAYLADARWPDGFRCPACGHHKGWELAKAFTFECAGCGKQTSVTAGTVMHGSKLPLTAWFWAAYLMATHSNGHPFQRHFGTATPQPTRPRLLQVGVAAVRQTSPRHGRAGSLAARRSRRGRRDGNPLAHQG